MLIPPVTEPKISTQHVQRPMLSFLISGYTLTSSDVSELTEALSRRDAWIEHYRKSERDLTDQVQEVQKFLGQVLESLRAPIIGYGIQDGKLYGMYHDRWVGPRLALIIQPERPVTRVTVHGWVPDRMPSGGQLTLRAGERTAVKDLVCGQFTLSIEKLDMPRHRPLFDVRRSGRR